jgi:hypothetical protein
LAVWLVLAFGLAVSAGADLALSGGVIQDGRARAAHRSHGTDGLAGLPAAVRAVVAQRLGAADRRFWARGPAESASFSEPGTGIDARLSSRGAVVHAGALSWSLGLRAVGRGSHLEPVSAAAPAIHANQATLRHAGGAEERYVYGPLGLEQGFTIGRRPSGPVGEAVALALGDLPSGVTLVVAADGLSLSLAHQGREVLRYWGLFANDASGRKLPARISVEGRAFSLRIDDRGARYPVRVDPFVQAAKLTASDGAAGDALGSAAVAISGDTIAVGTWPATVGNNTRQGAVYVFVKPNGGWANGQEVAKLTASDGAANDDLGWSVAISGDTILAGAPGAAVGASPQQGAAYLFSKPNGGWASEHEAAKLTHVTGTTGDNFGDSVALSPDTAVVGVPIEGNGIRQNTPGSVYVFAKPLAGWTTTGTPTAHLTASDGVVPDQVGFSVAIDGDTIVTGAEHEDLGANTEQGALYVFVKPGNGWADATETKKLIASDGGNANQLGYSVAISGDTIAAGAPFPSGAVYVFVRPANGWANAAGTETAKLTPSDPNGGFGKATGISGNTIVAGAPNVTVAGHANQGKLYVFTKPGGVWASGHEDQQLTASDGTSNDTLGSGAGISGGVIAGSAPGANQTAGAAYVFSSTVQAATTTTVSCLPGIVGVGTATTCTAIVSNGGATAPTGSAGFSTDSSGTFDSGGTCQLAPTGTPGKASCHVGYTPTAVGSGTHTITASYHGDVSDAASSGQSTVIVPGGGGGGGRRPTATAVSCAPASVSVGSPSGCGVTVTDTGKGSPVVPTGTVSVSTDSHGTFSSGSCMLVQVNAVTAGCVVGYTATAVDSGTHTITAVYGGDGAHSVSSGRGTVGVSAPPPTPPQNTAPPSIGPDRNCHWVFGRPVCQVIPFQYVCNPGQWAGNDPATPYQFEWQELYYGRVGGVLNPVWQRVGTGQTYYAFQRVTVLAPSDTFRCVVTATGPGGSAAAYSAAANLQVGPSLPPGIPLPKPVNVTVTGIEVTQAVQVDHCGGCVGTLPSRNQLNGNSPGQATYQGVTMAQGKVTVVRVYAHVASGTLSGATATLDLLDDKGNRLATFSPDSSPAQLTPSNCAGICVNRLERANPGSSFNFEIPWQETSRDFISFRATVTAPGGPNTGGQCFGCRGNVFTLLFVPFQPVATVQIHPIPLTIGGVQTGVPAGQVFAGAQAVFPVDFKIWNYDNVRPVDGENNSQAAINVLDRGGDDHLPLGDYPVGVFVNGAGGLGGNTISQFAAGGITDSASIVPDSGRPLTAVAHEIGHGLGLLHADTGGNCKDPNTGCPGAHPDGTPDCGGNSTANSPSRQSGELWPPDNEGRLQSIGLDIRNWQPGVPGSLPNTWVEAFDHQGNAAAGTQYYDLMSYCGAFPNNAQYETEHWISARNWSRVIDYPFYYTGYPDLPVQYGPAADRPDGVSGTPVRVMATVAPGGATTIQEVTAGASISLPSTPGSPFRIESRDAAGHILASVVPTTVTIHVDGMHPQDLLLAATLPLSAATASVAITASGQETARRARSAHPPAGRFLSPRPGARLGRSRVTVVRWSAHDADGDRLTSTVQYSPDGGRHWTVVGDGVTGGSARIPSHFLSASSNARLRVRISDGFDTTIVESGRLRAVGAPPVARITGAPGRASVLSTATLRLQGSAYDDTGRPLTGRRDSWYLGKRLIGHGDRLTLHNLKPGSAVIRLVATDARGRSGQATVRFRVRAAPPSYLLFDAPLLVSARAQTVRITVASSAPATITIAGSRYAVGLRPRTLLVHVRGGRSPLVLRCSLRSQGGVVQGTYVALRLGR